MSLLDVQDVRLHHRKLQSTLMKQYKYNCATIFTDLTIEYTGKQAYQEAKNSLSPKIGNKQARFCNHPRNLRVDPDSRHIPERFYKQHIFALSMIVEPRQAISSKNSRRRIMKNKMDNIPRENDCERESRMSHIFARKCGMIDAIY